jgi:hypothetical protein
MQSLNQGRTWFSLGSHKYMLLSPLPPSPNGVTNQMSVSAPMMVPGAAAPAPGGAGTGATTVIPSQMMPTTFPALGNFSTFLDPRDPMGPVVPRRSRRSQRHRRHSTRHRHNNRRRSSSQSSGSSGSGTESPYSVQTMILASTRDTIIMAQSPPASTQGHSLKHTLPTHPHPASECAVQFMGYRWHG